MFYHVAWVRKKTEESSTNRDHDSGNCQHIWDLYWLLLWYMQSILRNYNAYFAWLLTRFGRKDFAPVGPFNITWTTSGSDSGFLLFFICDGDRAERAFYGMLLNTISWIPVIIENSCGIFFLIVSFFPKSMTNFLEFLKEKEIKKQGIKVQKLPQKSLFFLVNSHCLVYIIIICSPYCKGLSDKIIF